MSLPPFIPIQPSQTYGPLSLRAKIYSWYQLQKMYIIYRFRKFFISRYPTVRKLNNILKLGGYRLEFEYYDFFGIYRIGKSTDDDNFITCIEMPFITNLDVNDVGNGFQVMLSEYIKDFNNTYAFISPVDIMMGRMMEIFTYIKKYNRQIKIKKMLKEIEDND